MLWMKILHVCRECGVELITSKNIAPSRLRTYNYICNRCLYVLYREKHLDYKKRYYLKHKQEIRDYQRNNREKLLIGQRKRQHNHKIKVISHYSNGTMECANPFGEHKEPYKTMDALSIDHINGGGTKHRLNRMYGHSGSYYWYIKNNYPEGFQVLCMNCQFIKRIKNNELKRK
jgi:hypothetical protein